jgi:hypothetical protein
MLLAIGGGPDDFEISLELEVFANRKQSFPRVVCDQDANAAIAGGHGTLQENQKRFLLLRIVPCRKSE